MNDTIPYIYLYTANLLFIVTNIYGWILKAFYRAKPYRDNYDNLFPSNRANETLYLLQIFEIPYLLMMPNVKALFYVNAFSILLFSSLMVVMADSYFFLRKQKVWPSILYFLPVALIVIYLLLAALELVPATNDTYRVVFWIVIVVFGYYVAKLVIIRRKIRTSIIAVDRGTYSNSDDFPVRFARRIEWVPIAICLLMFICFLFNNYYVKMGRDLLFTVVNVAFLIYTLNPHRKGAKIDECREQELEDKLIGNIDRANKYKLSEVRCREIEVKLFEMIEKEELFLDSHLTIDQLSQKLGVNKNYVSEVMSRSSQGSFYMVINNYRLGYAIEMLRKNPGLKIEHVALDSGFSSVSVFSQIFKRYKKISPSEFVKVLLKLK